MVDWLNRYDNRVAHTFSTFQPLNKPWRPVREHWPQAPNDRLTCGINSLGSIQIISPLFDCYQLFLIGRHRFFKRNLSFGCVFRYRV